ncbi:hypothetical protein ZIOFF_010970 [Zingiber officinale]|uniref:Uncharacterized protein n=1 Tax=Zingiber officinale TaxID=94328 RepID=A0A8J5LPQ9_ZINOF|nr:hypothetical protein ZIOFF_010970 [Zingiber officinale]
MSRRIIRQQSLLAAVPYLLRHQQMRWAHGRLSPRGSSSRGPSLPNKKTEGKSEWWTVDGEMHEVGEHVPRRERFVIPRDNLPNKRRKQMREQFMRSTRLVLKDTEHEPWCKKYMELYQELRENWERLYWDEGYSKKIAQDHANYESAEDDDLDFSPYRSTEHILDIENLEEEGHSGIEISQRIRQVRDRFEYERERRITDRAFAPMNTTNTPYPQNPNSRPYRSGAKFFPQTFRGYK